VEQIGHPRPAGVVPTFRGERGRGTGRPAHAAQPRTGRDPAVDGRADGQRRVAGAVAAALERAVEEVGDVLGQRIVVATPTEGEQHEQIGVAGADQHPEARRTERRAQLARQLRPTPGIRATGPRRRGQPVAAPAGGER
jgi:hypothetical protein